MAKLRSYHARRRQTSCGSGFGASLWRLLVLVLVLVGAVAYGLSGPANWPFAPTPPPGAAVDGRDRLYLPTGPSDRVIHFPDYTLGYDDDAERARWIAHRLTPGSIRGLREPVHASGAWRELEESTRDWVLAKGSTYVVSGPVLPDSPTATVPTAYYHVLLTEGGEGIGFVVPDGPQSAPLSAFAKTIDDVEDLTGLDFFPELEQLATDAVEAEARPERWPHDPDRYRRRLDGLNSD